MKDYQYILHDNLHWQKQLNYLNCDPTKRANQVYLATYHGKNHNLYYIGKTITSLYTRWSGHYRQWHHATNGSISDCDLLAALSEPQDWTIKVVTYSSNKNELADAEYYQIRSLIDNVPINSILNMIIQRPPQSALPAINERRRIWYKAFLTNNGFKKFQHSVYYRLTWNSEEDSPQYSFSNSIYPPISRSFYYVNNDDQLIFLYRHRAQIIDDTVPHSMLQMRHFYSTFLPEIPGDSAILQQRLKLIFQYMQAKSWGDPSISTLKIQQDKNTEKLFYQFPVFDDDCSNLLRNTNISIADDNWSNKLKYTSCSPDDSGLIIFKATYHGFKKDLYFIDSISTGSLKSALQIKYQRWKNIDSINNTPLDNFDIIAPLTSAKNWEIQILMRPKNMQSKNQLLQMSIDELFTRESIEQILNTRIGIIQRKWRNTVLERRSLWFNIIMKYSSSTVNSSPILDNDDWHYIPKQQPYYIDTAGLPPSNPRFYLLTNDTDMHYWYKYYKLTINNTAEADALALILRFSHINTTFLPMLYEDKMTTSKRLVRLYQSFISTNTVEQTKNICNNSNLSIQKKLKKLKQQLVCLDRILGFEDDIDNNPESIITLFHNRLAIANRDLDSVWSQQLSQVLEILQLWIRLNH